MRKRIWGMVVTLLLLTMTVSVSVSAETSGECGADGSDVRWEYADGTLTISGTGAIKDCSMTGWMPPRAGRAPWYSLKDEITNIVIDNGITDLGICAFSDCSNVTSVTIPDSVTKLGEQTFRKCSSLTSIEIPDGIIGCGTYLLEGCTALESATLPENITSVTYGMFSGCTSLTSIDIPDSVTLIGQEAFRGCINLASVEIPQNVTEIYMNAFSGCISLTSIDIPDSVNMIGQNAFSGCTGLISVHLPESLTEIYAGAFADCTSLTSIDIPENVTLIGGGDGYWSKGAFEGCSSLERITLPAGITYIGGYVFSGCNNLTIDYAGSKYYWREVEGHESVPSEITIRFNGHGLPPEKATSGKCGKNMTWNFDGMTLTISGTGKMTDYTATDIPWKNIKSGIRSVVIEEGVTEVSDGAFRDCGKLISVSLPKTLTSISNYMFYNSSPRSLVIPDGVKSIGSSAFGSLGYEKCIEIPDSVESIGSNAITYAGYIYYTGSESQWQAIDGSEAILFNNIEYNSHIPVETSGEYENYDYLTNSMQIWTWTLDNNGTLTIEGEGRIGGTANPSELPWYRFSDKIKKVVIKGEITSTGYGAFEGCINLKNVILPNNLVSIYHCTFYNCCSLESINIPDSVTRISSTAFAYCTNLKTVKMSKNVTMLFDDMFYGCSSLESITVPEGTTLIPENMFYGCKNLKSVTIPNTVTEIGKYAFYGCESLTSLSIPSSVTSIGNAAFVGCFGLKRIEIPVSVTSLGENTFNAYDNIADIYYPGSEEQWEAIEGSADIPSSITVHYNSHMPTQATSGTFGGLTWSLIKGILKIEGTGEMTGFESASQTPWYGISNKIESVEIADGVTSIGENAFGDCVSLMSVSIPKSVTSIEAGAFDDCFNMTEIHYAGTLDEWNEIATNDNNFDDIELCHQIPLTTPTVTKSETDTEWTFDVTVEQTYKNSYVYAASYNSDNQLIDLNKVELNMTGATSITLDKSPDAAVVKVFVWNNRMQPITTAAEF